MTHKFKLFLEACRSKRLAATKNKKTSASKQRAKTSAMSLEVPEVPQVQVSQDMRPNLQAIPTEVVRDILDHITEGRIGQFFLTREDIYTEEEERTFKEAVEALSNLCLVSKRLRDVTQPRLVECSGPILFLNIRHGATRPARESRSILQLVRTLLYRPDLRGFVRGVDLIGRWDRKEEDETTLRTLYHVFFRDIPRDLAFDLKQFEQTKGAKSRPIAKSIPPQVLREWVARSSDLPFWGIYGPADIDLLILMVQKLAYDTETTEILSKVLTDAFYQCSPGPGLLLLLLSQSIRSLVIHLEEDKIAHKERIMEFKLKQGAFVNLESATLEIYGGNIHSQKKGLSPPEGFFLRLPQLRWLRISRFGENLSDEADAFSKLEDIYGTSNVHILYLDTVKVLKPRYVRALLRSFKRLRSFYFRHTPLATDTSTTALSVHDDHVHTKGIMTGLRAQTDSLETLRIRCTRSCSQCSGVVRTPEFKELTHLEVFHKNLELGQKSAREIISLLPNKLQNLTIQYELATSISAANMPSIDPRRIPPHIRSALHGIGVFMGKGLSLHHTSDEGFSIMPDTSEAEPSNQNPLPELRSISVRRNEKALYEGPLHSSGLVNLYVRRWYEYGELQGERELREVFMKSKCAFRVCWDNYDFTCERNNDHA